MQHPFELGKTYRNRVGEYVVLSIDGNQMKIRYVSGGTLLTDVNMQARIWENIQFEEQMSRAEERRRLAIEARLAARTKVREKRAKPSFAGFRQEDFQPKKRGIAWANRRALGKALAYELSQGSKQDFGHWLVPHQSAVHVARKDQYEAETPGRNVALFVSVSEQGVSYGLHVGRPEGKVEPSWPWSTFMTALADGGKMRQALWAAIGKHKLTLDVYAMQVSYGLIGRATRQEAGFLWQQEMSREGVAQPMDWAELIETLQSMMPERRCELHWCKHLSTDEALAAGSEVTDQISAVFRDLLPVYAAGG